MLPSAAEGRATSLLCCFSGFSRHLDQLLDGRRDATEGGREDIESVAPCSLPPSPTMSDLERIPLPRKETTAPPPRPSPDLPTKANRRAEGRRSRWTHEILPSGLRSDTSTPVISFMRGRSINGDYYDSSNGGIMIKPEVLDRARRGGTPSESGLEFSHLRPAGRGHPSHSDRFAITPRGRASELESGGRNFERLKEFSCGK